MKRYERNHSCITLEDQKILAGAKVCVLGCGGLGGHIIEMLGRLGVGSITVVDGDVFEDSNLNRQILADNNTLGLPKARIAKERMAVINNHVDVKAVEGYINRGNAETIMAGHDLIMDALDHIDTRKMVAEVASTLDIPYIYGAIAGWFGQLAVIYPGDKTLDVLYQGSAVTGKEKELGNPSFTPALIASMQVAEAVKVLTGHGEIIRNGFLHIDTLNNDYEFFKLDFSPGKSTMA